MFSVCGIELHQSKGERLDQRDYHFKNLYSHLLRCIVAGVQMTDFDLSLMTLICKMTYNTTITDATMEIADLSLQGSIKNNPNGLLKV